MGTEGGREPDDLKSPEAVVGEWGVLLTGLAMISSRLEENVFPS